MHNHQKNCTKADCRTEPQWPAGSLFFSFYQSSAAATVGTTRMPAAMSIVWMVLRVLRDSSRMTAAPPAPSSTCTSARSPRTVGAPARWHAAQQGQAVCLCAPLRQSVGPADGKQARQEGRRHHQEHQHRREQQLAPQHAAVRSGRRLQNGNARLLLHGKHGGQRDRQEEETASQGPAGSILLGPK